MFSSQEASVRSIRGCCESHVSKHPETSWCTARQSEGLDPVLGRTSATGHRTKTSSIRSANPRGLVVPLLLLAMIAQSDYAFATNQQLNNCYAACERAEAKADVLCLVALVGGPPAFAACVLAARAAYWACVIECFDEHVLDAPAYQPIPREPLYNLRVDEPMVISFIRADIAGVVLEGPGTVISAEMSALAMADLDTTIPLAENPFIPLGNAAFDSTTNAWVFAWTRGEGDPTATVQDSLGFLVRACFTDVGDTIYPGYTLVSPPPNPTDVPAARSPGNLLVESNPNPFNPRTVISFGLSESGAVALDVFDVTGRQVKRLINGEVYSAGQHETVWDGTDMLGRRAAAGVYFCRLQAGNFSRTTRMALVK